MRDALQVDFACQFSFSRFVPDALPPAIMPRFSQPARSYMCQATQRLRPAVASGAPRPDGASSPPGHGAAWPCPGAKLPLALVWRQARTGQWTAEIGHKTPPELKFQKQRRYRVEGFGFKNILEGRRYLF